MSLPGRGFRVQCVVHYFFYPLPQDWNIPDRSYSIKLDSGIRVQGETYMGAVYSQKTCTMNNKQIFVVKSH